MLERQFKKFGLDHLVDSAVSRVDAAVVGVGQRNGFAAVGGGGRGVSSFTLRQQAVVATARNRCAEVRRIYNGLAEVGYTVLRQPGAELCGTPFKELRRALHNGGKLGGITDNLLGCVLTIITGETGRNKRVVVGGPQVKCRPCVVVSGAPLRPLWHAETMAGVKATLAGLGIEVFTGPGSELYGMRFSVLSDLLGEDGMVISDHALGDILTAMTGAASRVKGQARCRPRLGLKAAPEKLWHDETPAGVEAALNDIGYSVYRGVGGQLYGARSDVLHEALRDDGMVISECALGILFTALTGVAGRDKRFGGGMATCRPRLALTDGPEKLWFDDETAAAVGAVLIADGFVLHGGADRDRFATSFPELCAVLRRAGMRSPDTWLGKLIGEFTGAKTRGKNVGGNNVTMVPRLSRPGAPYVFKEL